MEQCNRCKREKTLKEVRYHDYESGDACKRICSACYRMALKRSRQMRCDRCRCTSEMQMTPSPLNETDKWCYFCIREYYYWYYMDYNTFCGIP